MADNCYTINNIKNDIKDLLSKPQITDADLNNFSNKYNLEIQKDVVSTCTSNNINDALNYVSTDECVDAIDQMCKTLFKKQVDIDLCNDKNAPSVHIKQDNTSKIKSVCIIKNVLNNFKSNNDVMLAINAAISDTNLDCNNPNLNNTLNNNIEITDIIRYNDKLRYDNGYGYVARHHDHRRIS